MNYTDTLSSEKIKLLMTAEREFLLEVDKRLILPWAKSVDRVKALLFTTWKNTMACVFLAVLIQSLVQTALSTETV